MIRASKNRLRVLVSRINAKRKKLGLREYELDFNSIYGGYCIEMKYSHHVVTERMPAKEMQRFLAGMLTILHDMELNS